MVRTRQGEIERNCCLFFFFLIIFLQNSNNKIVSLFFRPFEQKQLELFHLAVQYSGVWFELQQYALIWIYRRNVKREKN